MCELYDGTYTKYASVLRIDIINYGNSSVSDNIIRYVVYSVFILHSKRSRSRSILLDAFNTTLLWRGGWRCQTDNQLEIINSTHYIPYIRSYSPINSIYYYVQRLKWVMSCNLYNFYRLRTYLRSLTEAQTMVFVFVYRYKCIILYYVGIIL